MASIASVVSEYAITALFLWCFYYVVGVLVGLERSDSSKDLQEYRRETGKRFDNQLEKVITEDKRGKNGGDAVRVTLRRRGESSRNTLRELRKHQRSMKGKYYQNTENLLYFCFYKGLTEQYYKTLRQC